MPLTAGDSFLGPLLPDKDEHLWIVLNDPTPAGEILTVNLTSERPYSEKTVILNAGDHEFIKRPSSINYSRAQIRDAKELGKILNKRFIFISCQKFKPAILKKIQEGVLKSPRIRRKYKLFFQNLLI